MSPEPLIVLTPAHVAAGYYEFLGFDAEGQVRRRWHEFQVVLYRDDGMVLAIDPAGSEARRRRRGQAHESPLP
jgi:hypothetical protein